MWKNSEEVTHLKVASYHSPLTFSKLKHWIKKKKINPNYTIIFFREGGAVQNQEAWHHSSQKKKHTHLEYGPLRTVRYPFHITFWAHLFTYLGSLAHGHAAKALNKKQLM